MKTRLQSSRLTRVDIAALLAFFAVWIYYFVIVRYGICFPDEHFYAAVAERFVRGDRPLVDEWHLSQFSCIFLCLPYRIFVAVKGSSDGVILFMRCLFVAFNAVFYWIVYAKLRAYRWLSLITALLFCAYVPGGLFACNYYTMAIRLLMIVCLILFSGKQTPVSLFAAGILLSCSVLYQPGIAFLFFGYSILVLIRSLREKKGKRFLDDYAFCLNGRAWRYLSLGVLLSAAAFLTWLFAKSGLRNIASSFPDLLTDPEFDFYDRHAALGFLFRALESAVDVYGLVCLIPALMIVVLTAAYACGLFRRRRGAARNVLFFAACALWIFSCVYPFRPQNSALSDAFFAMYPAPMLWFGLVCYLLCSQKNKRLFYFWIVGAVSSVCIDVFSNTSMSLGCPIAYIADLVFFTDLVRELRGAQKSDPSRFSVRLPERAVCVVFSLWCVFILLTGNTVFPQHFIVRAPLFSFPYLCQNGPDRALHFPEAYGKDYEKKLADIDALKRTDPKNLYVCGLTPELYLYADLPCSTYSAWTWRKPSSLERNVQYWTAHPERLPSCIYVPFRESNNALDESGASAADLTAWVRESFDPLCTYTLENGQGGLILHVSQWHLSAGAA